MKQFIAFVNKEFSYLRDRRPYSSSWGFPWCRSCCLVRHQHRGKDLHVALYAPSPNGFTNGITERLHQSEYFTFRAELDDPIKMEESMRKGNLDMMVLFDTESEAVQLIINSSDPNRGSIAATYAMAVIGGYQQELAGITRMPFQIEVENRMIYNPEMKSAYMFVPGIMGLVLMLICTMMTSVSMRAKRASTMEVLLASPLKRGRWSSRKQSLTWRSWINFTSILLLSYYVLGVPIQGSLGTLTLISVLYIFLSLAFGLLISTLVRNQIAR